MKKEFVVLKSLAELVKEGYKEKESLWYQGDARFPTATISKGVGFLLGKKLELVEVSDRRNQLEVLFKGETYSLGQQVVKTKLKRMATKRIIVGKRIAAFNGYNFNFPCELYNANKYEALRIAKWVLKVCK